MKIEIKTSKEKIGIFSDDLASFENMFLDGGKLLLDKTPANFAAVAMVAQKYSVQGVDVVLSDKFAQDRAVCHNAPKAQYTPLWNNTVQPNGLKLALREGQLALASRILFSLAMLRGVYNCSEPGSGKTPTSIFCAQSIQNAQMMRGNFNFKCLVVAPGNLLWQWAGETSRFYAPFMAQNIFVSGKGADAEGRDLVLREFIKATSGWCFITYDTLRLNADAIAQMNPDLVIMDECTALINDATETSQVVHDMIMERVFRRLILLSGTSTRSSGADLWNPLKIVGNPYALGFGRKEWDTTHAKIETIFIEKVGARKVKRGIENIFPLMQNISDSFMGIPSDQSNVPQKNDIVIDLPMTEEEDREYRYLEVGYSKTPGKLASEQYDENDDTLERSHLLDEHRDEASLSSYLATITNGDMFDDGEDIGVEYAEGGVDELQDRIDKLRAEIDEIEIKEVDGFRKIIAAAEAKIGDIRTAIKDLKAISENEEIEFDGKFYYNQDHIELAKVGLATYNTQEQAKTDRNAAQARQKDIRARIAPIEEEMKRIKRELRLEEQERVNTLRRLLRAAQGTQRVISEDGTEASFVETYSSKLEWIREYITQQANTPETKTVIFTAHRICALRIARELRKEGVEVVCPLETNDSLKQEEMRLAFMSATSHVHTYIITSDRGVGLNLQNAKNMIFHSYFFRGDIHEQNIKRCVREYSSQQSVNIYYLNLLLNNGSSTVDRHVRTVVTKKLNVMSIVAANASPIVLRTTRQLVREAEEDTLRLLR
jgi:hypothetical protein